MLLIEIEYNQVNQLIETSMPVKNKREMFFQDLIISLQKSNSPATMTMRFQQFIFGGYNAHSKKSKLKKLKREKNSLILNYSEAEFESGLGVATNS